MGAVASGEGERLVHAALIGADRLGGAEGALPLLEREAQPASRAGRGLGGEGGEYAEGNGVRGRGHGGLRSSGRARGADPVRARSTGPGGYGSVLLGYPRARDSCPATALLVCPNPRHDAGRPGLSPRLTQQTTQ